MFICIRPLSTRLLYLALLWEMDFWMKVLFICNFKRPELSVLAILKNES
jgi:hypothetical protein